MKIAGGRRLSLGEHPRFAPRGGVRVKRELPPKRPDFVDEEGNLLEVVWYPHRDALLLLPPYGYDRLDDTQARGRVMSKGRTPAWSWWG
jgi:hypothetical protein